MPEEDAVPGAVIAIQSFGDFLGFNPHLHILCTDGCFYGNGMFREEYRKNWARLIQKIHSVEFPEGNPIQQGLLRSGLVRLRRIIPLRTMSPNSKPALAFDWGDGHGSQQEPLSRFSQNKLNYALNFKLSNAIAA